MAGIRFKQIPGSGLFARRLVMREGNSVVKNFGLTDTKFFRKIPKPKFLFFVRFKSNFTGSELPTGFDATKLNDPQNGIVFPLKNIDRPKLQPSTETLNQYNKKRVIQTKIEYQPVTMSFHDDIEDKVMSFWADYYAFYYGDGGKVHVNDWASDQTKGDFIDTVSGWGYRGKFRHGIAENQHYLSDITIYQFFGGQYTTMTFVRPIITMFDHDQADYAEGSTGSGVTMSFDYEGVYYNLVKKRITDKEFVQFGFADDWYEPEPQGFLDSLLSNTGGPFRSGNGIRDMFRGGGLLNQALGGLAKRAGIPPTGANLITNSILRLSRSNIDSGTSIFTGLRTAFGRSAFGIAGQTIGTTADLVQISSVTKNSRNTADLLNKQIGIQSATNNFGPTPQTTSGNAITGIPSSINTGTSPAALAAAASTLVALSSNIMAGVLETNNITTTNLRGEDFSSTFGSAANIAKQQQLVKTLGANTPQLSEESAMTDSIVSVLPSGKFALTNKGAAVMNALRAPTSAVGTKVPENPWKDPNQRNNNNRALKLERRSK